MIGLSDFVLISGVIIVMAAILAGIFAFFERFFAKTVNVVYFYKFICGILILHASAILYLPFRLIFLLCAYPYTGIFGTPTPQMQVFLLLILYVWLVGVIYQLGKHLKDSVCICWICHRKAPAPLHYKMILKQVCREMGIKRKIHLYRSYVTDTAFICGVWKISIYLPVDELDDQSLEILFAHELQHLRQGDIILKFLSSLLCIIYWFWYPAYYIRDKYNFLAEVRADEYGVDRVGDAKKYYDMLMEFAELMEGANNMLVPAWIEDSGDVKERLRRLTHCKVKHTGRVCVFLMIFVFLGTGSSTVYITSKAAETGYNYMWAETMVGQEEELDPLPVYQEYEGTVEEFEGMTVVEGEEQATRSGFINCTLANQSYYRSAGISKSAGDTIKVMVSIEPTNKEVKVGIIKPDGTTTYVKGSDTIVKTFNITKKGAYKVFIANYSGVKISAYGTYK